MTRNDVYNALELIYNFSDDLNKTENFLKEHSNDIGLMVHLAETLTSTKVQEISPETFGELTDFEYNSLISWGFGDILKDYGVRSKPINLKENHYLFLEMDDVSYNTTKQWLSGIIEEIREQNWSCNNHKIFMIIYYENEDGSVVVPTYKWFISLINDFVKMVGEDLISVYSADLTTSFTSYSFLNFVEKENSIPLRLDANLVSRLRRFDTAALDSVIEYEGSYRVMKEDSDLLLITHNQYESAPIFTLAYIALKHRLKLSFESVGNLPAMFYDAVSFLFKGEWKDTHSYLEYLKQLDGQPVFVCHNKQPVNRGILHVNNYTKDPVLHYLPIDVLLSNNEPDVEILRAQPLNINLSEVQPVPAQQALVAILPLYTEALKNRNDKKNETRDTHLEFNANKIDVFDSLLEHIQKLCVLVLRKDLTSIREVIFFISEQKIYFGVTDSQQPQFNVNIKSDVTPDLINVDVLLNIVYPTYLVNDFNSAIDNTIPKTSLSIIELCDEELKALHIHFKTNGITSSQESRQFLLDEHFSAYLLTFGIGYDVVGRKIFNQLYKRDPLLIRDIKYNLAGYTYGLLSVIETV